MPDPLEDLIQDHLAGRLDADGVAQLESWLKADRANRERYVRAARFSANLRQLANDRLARQSAGVPSARLSRLRVRRRPLGAWGPWLVAASLLIAIGGWWAMRPTVPAVDGVAILVAGIVRGQDGQDLARNAPIVARARLHVTRTATVRWADGSELELLAGSRVTVVTDGVSLEDGACNAAIKPRAKDAPFVIDSTHARVTVVGTHFRVIADQSSTAVAVTEGIVRVHDRVGGDVLVTAGQSVVARVTGIEPRTLTVAPSGASPPGSYPTMQAAVDAARAGDTVLLLPGRHQQAASKIHVVSITKGGRADAPLILRAQPGAEIISGSWQGVLIEGASWVRLEGLRISAAPSATMAGNGILIVKGSQHIVVSGCTIQGMGGDGVAISESGWVEVVGNLIDGCGGTSDFGSGGIAIGHPTAVGAGSGPMISITGNRILRSQTTKRNTHGDGWTGGNGIAINGLAAKPVGSATQRIRIKGNLIAGNAGNAIFANNAVGLDIEDNTCHYNGRLPQHQGAELALYAKDLRLVRNLLVPSPSRLAWTLDKRPPSERTGNRVWGGKNAAVAERLTANPFTTTITSEELRLDFTLRPGIGAGASP